MKKMPPAIFTGTVFGLLQSFGLGIYMKTRQVVVTPIGTAFLNAHPQMLFIINHLAAYYLHSFPLSHLH